VNLAVEAFDKDFETLTGFSPFRWQKRLFEHLIQGNVPAALDLPTGLGKTSVIAIWLIARAHGAKLPRRLVYVVDRRAVVDQATDEAGKLRDALDGKAKHFDELDEDRKAQVTQIATELKKQLGFDHKRSLPISTLRGAHVDNREWLDDPAVPAIIVGTIDMIGSRLLFEGYGVSRKMRPYQAGLLGVDTLIVLDEAHLVPPFAHLMRAIEHDSSFWPSDEADRSLLPRFVFLPLSATQRTLQAAAARSPFRLEEEDAGADAVVRMRLCSKKRLWLEDLGGRKLEDALANEAWKFSDEGRRLTRCVVYCDSRDVAEKVKCDIDTKAARKKGNPIADTALFVGARRVHEREKVAQWLKKRGFIGDKKSLEKPAFLIATSAGEVGVDIDADHMVCDLVAWERMVQRLGRVNRRGEGDADIAVFGSKPAIKDPNALTEAEERNLTAFNSKAVIESLSQIDGALNASPRALRDLAERAQRDDVLKAHIEAATTLEPLRPALNRALVDAWSMTSLEVHTGRPDVAPWLRGWLEELPQTTIVWRAHLPIRVDNRGHPLRPVGKEIDIFFEAAPPRQSEKLETESYRVASWLQERGTALLNNRPHAQEENVEGEDSQDRGLVAALTGTKLHRDDIVALVLSSSGDYVGHRTLGDLAQQRKGSELKEFEGKLAGKIVVVDARVRGLKEGLLNGTSEDPVETADSSDQWSRAAQFRVRRVRTDDEAQEDGWWFEDDFVLQRNDEGARLEWLRVEHFRDAAEREDARAISKPQELSVHQEWAKREMLRIAGALDLPATAAGALAVGAGLHDEGKRALRWQRAFKAPRDTKRFGLAGPLAKTKGPIDQAMLGGYRHEFGSLRYVEQDSEFRALPDDWYELVLHLVAAHHGQARPVIETRGCEDGPPSLLEERARFVAFRFARLHKRWGPWGLAWWEALMRAADQRASRDNEEGQAPPPMEGM